MSVLLIIGFFMSLFLVLLIIGKKTKTDTDGYLSGMFTVYALTIGGAYLELYNRHNGYPLPHLMNISWLFLLLHGPLLWFYIKSLIVDRFRFRRIYFIHFIPFALFSVLQYFNFIILPETEKLQVVQNELFRDMLLYKISVPAIGISTITYNIWALILLQNHRKNIRNQFSTVEGIDLTWLKTIVIASLVVFSVNVTLFNLNNLLQFSGYYDLSLTAYIFATFYVLYLGFFGIRQGKVFTSHQAVADEQGGRSMKERTQKTGEKQDYSEIISRLTRLMEQEQPYLEPEISLSGLSRRLEIKPEVLSDVLNSWMNQNFFDFINRYRVEEFKIQCLNKDKRHLSIMGIAYECGFNSKAAFYRAFNKFEGISPTAYISKTS